MEIQGSTTHYGSRCATMGPASRQGTQAWRKTVSDSPTRGPDSNSSTERPTASSSSTSMLHHRAPFAVSSSRPECMEAPRREPQSLDRG